MTPPTNTYTVTIADAHAHSIAQAGVAAASKWEAVLFVAQTWQDAPQIFGAFVIADTWTVTITQP